MLKHHHLIVRAEVKNPPMKTETESMVKWFEKLVKTIKMNILMGPYVIYSDTEGNRGFTGVCVIDTSHIALHVWDEQTPATMQLDIYSCASFDTGKAIKCLDVFSPKKIEYCFIDREKSLKEIKGGTKLSHFQQLDFEF